MCEILISSPLNMPVNKIDIKPVKYHFSHARLTIVELHTILYRRLWRHQWMKRNQSKWVAETIDGVVS